MASTKLNNRDNVRRVLHHFQGTLGSGLLVILPLVITFWVVKFIFDLVEPIMQNLVLRPVPGPSFPGMGMLAFVALVYVAGWVTNHGLGRRLINAGHRVVESVPGISRIYSPLRQAMQLLDNNEERPDGSVVLVEFPRRGAKSLGLITSNIGEINGEEMVAVYVPTTPVPSSGFLIVVPDKDVVHTSISVDDAMKIIISGGLLTSNVLGADPHMRDPFTREREHD